MEKHYISGMSDSNAAIAVSVFLLHSGKSQLYLFFYYIQENLNAFNSLINSREIGRCSFWEDGLCSLFAFHFEKEAVLMTNANTSEALPVNRTFKSTLFIMLFEDKKNLLEGTA